MAPELDKAVAICQWIPKPWMPTEDDYKRMVGEE